MQVMSQHGGIYFDFRGVYHYSNIVSFPVRYVRIFKIAMLAPVDFSEIIQSIEYA